MKKILVIEDEPEMRRNITALLRYHDYEPIEAGDGRDVKLPLAELKANPSKRKE